MSKSDESWEQLARSGLLSGRRDPDEPLPTLQDLKGGRRERGFREYQPEGRKPGEGGGAEAGSGDATPPPERPRGASGAGPTP